MSAADDATPVLAPEEGGGVGGMGADHTGRRAEARDLDGAQASRDRFSFLAEASRCLADSLDYEATLTTVAGMSLPYLDAWCIVDVVAGGTEDGAIRRLAVLHPDPRKQEAARELHRRYPPQADDFIGAPRVLRTGRPEMVFQVPDAALVAAARDPEQLALLRTLGVEAYVIAPMVARGRVLGAMTFVTAEAGRRFGDIDVLLAEDLARRAAMAVDNAWLYHEAVAARAEAEATLARAAALAAELAEARDAADMARTATRAARLQALSAALAEASAQDQVAQAVVAHARAVFGAAGIVIARLTGDGQYLEVMSVSAMPDDLMNEWSRFAVSAHVPLADVARTGKPLFLESRGAWGEHYPDMAPLLDASGHHANVVVPLVVDGRVIGVLGAAFDAPRPFGEDDRALALAVAQQCAQSLERARLFEAEGAARAEAEAARAESETARAAAEAANRVKGEFLAAMSHELRTPLNAIAGYTQLLEMGLHGPVTPAQCEALGRIDRAQRHLLRLVNEVLNFERLQAGRIEYDVTSVRLAAVVAEVEPLIGPQLQAKGLTYVVDVSDDRVVRADRDKLVQVLLNLLSNALKFTPAGGRVTVECTARGDGSGNPATVFLRVTDTGVGIPRDKFDAVFEPFVQVDATPAGRVAGAGLGLAISRDLARGMGGELRVRSTVGVGTTFTVALPRAGAEAGPAAAR